MNKVLSILLMAVLSFSSFATDITFNANTDKGELSITKDGITVAITGGTLNNGTDYRCYKSRTLTITSTIGNITRVEFTSTNQDSEKYGPGCFSGATSGTYTYGGYIGTWTGDAETFSLTASLNQVRMTSIVVTVGASSTPNVTYCSTISDIKALNDNAKFTFDADVVCVAQSGKRLYVQDETGGMLIYGDPKQQYVSGDIIPSGWSGTKIMYDGNPEVTTISGFTESTISSSLSVKEIHLNNIDMVSDFGRFVVIKNAMLVSSNQNISIRKVQTTTSNFNITTSEGTILAYVKQLNNSNNPLEVPDDWTVPYNVYGVLTSHIDNSETVPEILPMGFIDQNGVVTNICNINSDTINTIYYNINGISSNTPFTGLNIKIVNGKTTVIYIK